MTKRKRRESPISQSAPPARYDGWADWYNAYLGRSLYDVPSHVVRLVGPGDGICLDAGCGTGVHLAALASLGWRVVGMDLSADQLRLAGGRWSALIQGDMTTIPIASESTSRCVSILTLTDLDDVGSFFVEVQRILRPGGRLVLVTTHPCFVGPFMKVEGGSDGVGHIFPGYRETRRVLEGPGIGPGIRSRVGVRHVPLAELLNKLIRSGLEMEFAEELGQGTIPWLLAVVARKGQLERPTG